MIWGFLQDAMLFLTLITFSTNGIHMVLDDGNEGQILEGIIPECMMAAV